MSRMIFINLPVKNLERSRRFYEAIGTRQEPRFSNEQGTIMHFSDQIAVMLLTHDFYRTSPVSRSATLTGPVARCCASAATAHRRWGHG